MTAAARSVTWFGFYLYLTGILLLVIPNTFLRIVQMPETREVWIRIVGILVLAIGYYYHQIGQTGHLLFLKLTIQVRCVVFLAFAILVFLQWAPPMLLVFGTIDLAGAGWTWISLRKSP